MKIEVGKKYITADGNIVELIDTIEERDYYYMDNMRATYTKAGTYWYQDICDRDLICEIVPSIYALYKSGIIDLKELIKQHIEYYTK